MAITGKKINELDSITSLTNDSVLPVVIVNSGTAESTAKKVSVSQLASAIGGSGSIPTSYYYQSPSWTISGDNKTLTIDTLSNPQKVLVFKNGLKLRPDTNSTSVDYDYYLSGNSLRFNIALESTDVINLEVFF